MLLDAFVAAGTIVLALLWLSPLSDVISLFVVAGRRHRDASTTRIQPGFTTEHPEQRPRLLFLVPAHNEQLLIASCVSSLVRMQAAHCDHTTLVVLDACTDDTERRAREAGAKVVDFGHTHALGKARLLDEAVRRGVHERFDALVVIDADSEVDASFADAMATAPGLCSAVQQGYHTLANPTESWLTRLAAVLNSGRYDWQLPLRARAGLNVPMTGNGMCLGRDVLRQHGVHCETIKEDLELYARYTLAGVRIVFCPRAVVYAQEARSLTDARTQRVRWATGKWGIARRYAWPLARSDIPVLQRVDALSEITHQGPVIHATTAIVLSVPLVGQDGYAGFLALVLIGSTIPSLIWATLGFVRQPKRGRLLLAFAALPIYVVWRIVIFFIATLSTSAPDWRRSPRHVKLDEASGKTQEE